VNTFDRPPILLAAHALGLRDIDVARLLEVTPAAVGNWSSGRSPVPRVAQTRLRVILTPYLNQLRNVTPAGERNQRRHEAALNVAALQLAIALAEEGEDIRREAAGLKHKTADYQQRASRVAAATAAAEQALEDLRAVLRKQAGGGAKRKAKEPA
jgi:hypothetical protein